MKLIKCEILIGEKIFFKILAGNFSAIIYVPKMEKLKFSPEIVAFYHNPVWTLRAKISTLPYFSKLSKYIFS